MTITVSREMWEHIISLIITCQTHCGMAVAVLVVMVVVLKLECRGSIGSYRCVYIIYIAEDFEVCICKTGNNYNEDIRSC